jgi:hypothetical protein
VTVTDASPSIPVTGEKTGTGYFVPKQNDKGEIVSMREATRTELRAINPTQAQMMDIQDAMDQMVLDSLFG